MSCPKILPDLEELYSLCYDRVHGFPKLDKHLLGKEILSAINNAHYYALLSINDRRYALQLGASFDLSKKFLRLALKRKMISEGWYADRLPLLADIGRAVGGIIAKNKTPRF